LAECVRQWAAAYRERGLGVCKLRPGEKRPTYAKWNRFSLPPERFGPGDSIGLLSGRLSDDLVCVDIDCVKALEEADHYLPATGAVEGRPGKPCSHRWYRVVDIPEAWTATCAGGIGGPRTAQFARGPGDMVVEFRGTGTQAVVPPSTWTSKDGTKRERRAWHAFGEPTVLSCTELLGAVARFATAFGGRNSRWEGQMRSRAERPPRLKKDRAAPELLPLPTGEAAQRARAYLSKVEPAVEGQGGDWQTFYVACLLVLDFALPPEEALPLLLEWNRRCAPPWSVEELARKLEAADTLEGPRGAKLRQRSARTVEVHIRPGDREVLVGVGCAVEGASYVNLAPDLWAAMVRHGNSFGLVGELDAIDWAGKVVMLAAPSNVTTNKKLVFDEFHLASLLRERGANVQCLRIGSPDGRRSTLSDAQEVEVTAPPLTPREAATAAHTASCRAREQDAARRARPRNKPSPTLEEAIVWVREQNAEKVTKQLLKRGRRKGFSERTIRRALRMIRETKSNSSYS